MKTVETPIFQDFHIEGVKHIAPKDAYELIQTKQAVMIDVREMDEVKAEGVDMEGVLYHPMSAILDRLSYISKNQKIILACPGGVRSSKVANLLNRFDYPEVANLDGGLMQWKVQGLPYKVHLKINTGAGCGCGCGTENDNLIQDKSCC
jgi:rhodanese-related sulfurtransferase